MKNALTTQRYTGNKSQLNVNTSVVDWLKSKDYASSLSDREKIWRALGGSGTYSGSASQNTWMLNRLKKSGFSSGNNEVKDIIRATGEDGIALVKKGESIFKPEHTENIKLLAKTVNPLADVVKKLDLNKDIFKESSKPINITEGDIIINGSNLTRVELENAIKNAKSDMQSQFIKHINFGNFKRGIK